jgi:hypothetical protein
VQFAYRRDSVALAFISDCRAGCYTLIGRVLDNG